MAVPEDTGYPLKWFKQQESVRNTYQCGICLEVLKDPVQVRDCGHQFCRNCVDGVFRLQSWPRCPLCQKNISKEMVFTDNAAKRAIDNQVVNCPNTGCEWNGQLSSLLKEHTGMCPFFILSCNNVGCNVKVSRRNFNLHLAVCEHRFVVCQYCNNGHVFKEKLKHYKTCPCLPVGCKNKCSQRDIPRNKMKEHLEKVCIKTVIKCKHLEIGCTYKCERREMEEHLNQGMKNHLELSTLEISRLKDQHQKDIDKLRQEIAAVHQKDMEKLRQEIAAVHQKDMAKLRQEIAAVKCERREMEEHFNQEMKDHLELSTLEISRLKDQHKKDIDKLRHEIAAVHQKDMEKLRQEIAAVHQKDMAKLRQEIAAVKHQKDIKKLRQEIAEVHQKDMEELRQETDAVRQKDMEELKQEIAAVKVSHTAVIITDFNRKLSEAKNSNAFATIYGDPFLTSPLGYKIKMLVNLNETSEAYKDHMGVYTCLMKTDHDAMLPWPFKKKRTYTLIDQQDNEQERKNIVKTATPAGQDEFKRPKDKENIGIGLPSFVSHATLKTRKYIKDDTVFITVDIEP